jgi:hypothetical protein
MDGEQVKSTHLMLNDELVVLSVNGKTTEVKRATVTMPRPG